MPKRVSLLLCLASAACSGGSSTTADTSIGSTLRRVEGFLSSGENLQLAAALLAADPLRPGGPGSSVPVTDPALATELALTADGVVRFLALESGAGADPVWSPLVERLAESADAPDDANQNGTNRDEVLAELRDRYVFRTNAKVPEELRQGFLIPGALASRIDGRPVSRGDARNLRVRTPAPEQLRFAPGDFGAAVLAWTRRAAALLARGRGDLYGATAAEGMRGLLLLEQALAAERFVLGELAYDGGTLGGIADPAAYDASQAPKLFPSQVQYEIEPARSGLPARPRSFLAADRGANLIDQARLLRGFAELAWLASERQSNALLRRLFEGDPFGKGPGGSRIERDPPSGGPASLITWEQHIKGLLAGSCSGLACHAPGRLGGMSIATYENVLLGGDHRETNPTVVKNKSRESLLWQIVALQNPPVSERMPRGGPFLGQPQIDLIAEWIDDGALEKDPGQKIVEPDHGRDGVRVLLQNLRVLHLEAVSGALVDRVDLKGPGVLVAADSAGEALLALAAAAEAVPGLPDARALLEGHARFVAAKLVGTDGRVLESHLLEPDEPATAPASIGAAASVIAGLFEAHRVLGLDVLKQAASRAAEFWWREYRIAAANPATFPGALAGRLTPADLARVLDAAASWFAVTSDARARELVARSWELAKSRGLLLAEWPETGEALRDGDDDTDADGVVEVGIGGMPPLFAAAIENEHMLRGSGVPERRVHYARDLLPTLIVHCGACHTGGAKLGGFQCDTYVDLYHGGDFRAQMPIAVPGRPQQSLFWRKVEDRPPPLGGPMPEGGPPLSPSFRALIRKWIEQGAVKD